MERGAKWGVVVRKYCEGRKITNFRKIKKFVVGS